MDENNTDGQLFGLATPDLVLIKPNYEIMIKGRYLKVTEMGVPTSRWIKSLTSFIKQTKSNEGWRKVSLATIQYKSKRITINDRYKYCSIMHALLVSEIVLSYQNNYLLVIANIFSI